MPQIVVTQEMKDYAAYSKKKAREAFWSDVMAVIIGTSGLVYLWWIFRNG